MFRGDRLFSQGMHDAIPIALGYFAVAFSLGIAARDAGLNAMQGTIASFLNNASAGEFAGFQVIQGGGTYLEIAVITLIVNARYLLMSCALSQRFALETPFFHRFFIAFDVTDELFGIVIARPGFLEPRYFYGAMTLALPGWALGTGCGIIAGNVMPERVVSALSVALFGMFIAIIIPPARKNRAVALTVVAGFAASFLASVLPYLRTCSEGTRAIMLTVLIAGAAACFAPRKDDAAKSGEAAK